MISLQSAQAALKDVYLGVLSTQLNNETDPLLSKIKQSSTNVYGRNIIKLVPFGINGGFCAGDEGDALPNSAENKYLNFTSTLKNLFGTLEITDKAIRASSTDKGAFINLLDAEMSSLLSSSKFNLARMLYGDGSGALDLDVTLDTTNDAITVSHIARYFVGMSVDVYEDTTKILSNARVKDVDHNTNKIYLASDMSGITVDNSKDYHVYFAGSKGQEITGIDAIFDTSQTLYGLNRATYTSLCPYIHTMGLGETFNEAFMQGAIDQIEMQSNGHIDMVFAGHDARLKLVSALLTYRKNLDFANLKGGITTLSFNGLPVYNYKFGDDNSMLFVNSDDFTMYQLCDWEWLTNEDGSILKQKENYAIFTATLVKYADLICARPYCRKISLILETG